MKGKYAEMTKAQLYEEAKTRNVSGRGKMTKAELVSALQKIASGGGLGSSGRLVSRQRPPKAPEQPGPERPEPGDSSLLTSAPPHPTAPQYLTPPPLEVYRGEEGPALPDRLPGTVLEAMPRDPNWVFLYWVVGSEKRHEIQSRHGEWIFERSLSVLRIHDLDEGGCRDVPVLLESRNWYLPVLPDREYRFELWLIEPSGQFVVLASSRGVRTPAAEPTFRGEEEWLAVEEYFRELVDVCGESAGGSRPGSSGRRRVQRGESGWKESTTMTSWGVRQ